MFPVDRKSLSDHHWRESKWLPKAHIHKCIAHAHISIRERVRFSIFSEISFRLQSLQNVCNISNFETAAFTSSNNAVHTSSWNHRNKTFEANVCAHTIVCWLWLFEFISFEFFSFLFLLIALFTGTYVVLCVYTGGCIFKVKTLWNNARSNLLNLFFFRVLHAACAYFHTIRCVMCRCVHDFVMLMMIVHSFPYE